MGCNRVFIVTEEQTKRGGRAATQSSEANLFVESRLQLRFDEQMRNLIHAILGPHEDLRFPVI